MLKWLDKQMRVNHKEYAEETLESARLKYLQALDLVDYAQSEVEYRRKQIERLEKYETNNPKREPTASAPSPSSDYIVPRGDYPI